MKRQEVRGRERVCVWSERKSREKIQAVFYKKMTHGKVSRRSLSLVCIINGI